MLHVLVTAAIAVENLPDSQELHTALPTATLNVPAPHCVHEAAVSPPKPALHIQTPADRQAFAKQACRHTVFPNPGICVDKHAVQVVFPIPFAIVLLVQGLEA